MATRRLLEQFQFPNVGYIGCTVTVYVADGNGDATAVLATLYDDFVGAGTLANPQTFDSVGKLPQLTFFDQPIVANVTIGVTPLDSTGPMTPQGGARGDYVAGGTLYLPGDTIRDGAAGTNLKDLWGIVNLFVSTTWAADSADATKMVKQVDYVDLTNTVVPDADTAVKGKVALATATEVLTGTDIAKSVTSDALASLWEAGADVADGATITLNDGGSFDLITSATAITAIVFGTSKIGRKVVCQASTVRTITHHATNLICPGGVDIKTMVGDLFEVEDIGSGHARINWYTPIDTISFSANKAGTDQTGIASATYTKVTFTNEEYDIGGIFDAPNSRCTPPPGRYLVTSGIYANAGIVDQNLNQIVIYKNGVAHRYGMTINASGSGAVGPAVSAIVVANGTDYFEIYANFGGAGTKTISGGANLTFFQMHRIA